MFTSTGSFPVASAVALVLSATLSAAQSVELSGLEPLGYGAVRTRSVQLAPDGRTLLYLAQHDTPLAYDVYAAPLDGSLPARRLSASLASQTTVDIHGPQAFEIGSDSKWAVYAVSPAGGAAPASGPWAARIDGSAPPVALSDENWGSAFRMLPDGASVLLAGAGTLWIRIVDASEPATPLATFSGVAREILVTPDGARAVYLARSLYSVPTDGSAEPVLLSAPLLFDEDIGAVRLAPDGRWIVYETVRDLGDAIVRRIYRVPADGGTPAERLDTGLTLSEEPFAFTPDARSVLFSATVGGAAGPLGIFRARLASGTGRKRIVAGASLFRISPDGRHLAFARAGELFVRPLVNGRLAPIEPEERLVGELGAAPRFGFAPDGRILFRRDSVRIGELMSMGPGGQGTPVSLAPALRVTAVPDVFTPDGTRAAFRAETFAAVFAGIYTVPADGSAPPVRVDPDSSGGETSAFGGDGARVAFIALDSEGAKNQLFSTPSAGGVALQLGQDPPPSFGSVFELRVAPGESACSTPRPRSRRRSASSSPHPPTAASRRPSSATSCSRPAAPWIRSRSLPTASTRTSSRAAPT
jgi:hypothetical protein